MQTHQSFKLKYYIYVPYIFNHMMMLNYYHFIAALYFSNTYIRVCPLWPLFDYRIGYGVVPTWYRIGYDVVPAGYRCHLKTMMLVPRDLIT